VSQNESGIVWLALLLIVAVFAGFVLPGLQKRMRAAKVTVDETQTGLLVRKGVVAETLKPGVYSLFLKPDERIETYDMREASLGVGGQEMLTADQMAVKVSLIVRWRISDVRLHRAASKSPALRLYEDVQVALRERVAASTLDALLADRSLLTKDMIEGLSASARPFGMEVTGLDVRDFTLSGAAKQAFADIWKAQKEGQAALERARAEQASLRSLANAARMLKGNPELMNLRLLQALAPGAGKGAPTIVLGGGAGLLPVSRDAGPDQDAGEG
jgi:regulator of protease activity HflC (stomatin/prohibitin superfamily)